MSGVVLGTDAANIGVAWGQRAERFTGLFDDNEQTYVHVES